MLYFNDNNQQLYQFGPTNNIRKVEIFTANPFRFIFLDNDDLDTDVKRFNGKKKESDPSPIISLGSFKSPSNGYLVEDKCTFGVEIFVLEDGGETRASFRTLMEESKKVGRWNVRKFFLLEKPRSVYSEPFTVEFPLENVYTWLVYFATHQSSISFFLL